MRRRDTRNEDVIITSCARPASPLSTKTDIHDCAQAWTPFSRILDEKLNIPFSSEIADFGPINPLIEAKPDFTFVILDKIQFLWNRD